LREVGANEKAMRGRIALLRHSVRNVVEAVLRFAKALECVRVLASLLARRRFSSGWINDGADLRNLVRRKTALPGMFPNQFLVRRDVNAINPIVHHVAFDPLDLWSELAQHSAGFPRDGLELFPR